MCFLLKFTQNPRNVWESLDNFPYNNWLEIVTYILYKRLIASQTTNTIKNIRSMFTDNGRKGLLKQTILQINVYF